MVLKLRSNNNIVIAAAKTGKDKSKRSVVTKTVQQNKGMENISHLLDFILNKVVIKFNEPRILETPAKCKEKMAQSRAALECARFLAKGG